MSEPQVKGSLLQGLVETLRELVDRGEISQEMLEARLSVEAIEIVDSKPILVAWYPVACYREMLDLFWQVSGNRAPEFMRDAGEAGARALVESGLYQGFLDAGSGSSHDTVEALIRRARLAVGMTRLLYDFVEVHVEHDATENTIRLIYENASPFSEAMFLGTHGFLNGLAGCILEAGARPRMGRRFQWQAARPDPDHLVFWHDVEEFLS